jgi:hypothetical protein
MEASLGKLLKFDGPKKQAETAQSVSGQAQILIFTGVRYERGTPPPPPTTELSPKGRKRKRV